jgi:hypothetical protein
LLPPLPKRSTAPETPQGRFRSAGSDESIIHQYNQATSLVGLLEYAGGRVAQRLFNGGMLMHCPCPHHKHGDARPSLELKPAKNRNRYGEFVAFGYTPSCQFYTESGRVIDAFSVMCLIEGLSPTEAVKKLKE